MTLESFSWEKLGTHGYPMTRHQVDIFTKNQLENSRKPCILQGKLMMRSCK